MLRENYGRVRLPAKENCVLPFHAGKGQPCSIVYPIGPASAQLAAIFAGCVLVMVLGRILIVGNGRPTAADRVDSSTSGTWARRYQISGPVASHIHVPDAAA